MNRKRSSDYKLFTIHYSLFIELHVSEAFLVRQQGLEPRTDRL